MSDSAQESQKCHLSKIRPHGLRRSKPRWAHQPRAKLRSLSARTQAARHSRITGSGGLRIDRRGGMPQPARRRRSGVDHALQLSHQSWAGDRGRSRSPPRGGRRRVLKVSGIALEWGLTVRSAMLSDDSALTTVSWRPAMRRDLRRAESFHAPLAPFLERFAASLASLA